MYIPVFWQDRIVEHPRRVRVTDLGNGIKEWAPDPGEISQKGTQQSSTNFGNMDFGNVENALLGAYLAMNVRLAHNYIDDLRGQIITSTLKNTLKFPATNAEATIPLPQMVNNTEYQVEAEIVEADGPVEHVEVYGKAMNAFKASYLGSAKNVTIKFHVKGGLY